MVLIIVESDSIFKYKAKETLPVKEKASNGWVFHSMKPNLREANWGYRQPQLKLQGPRMLGQAEEPTR